MGLNVLNQYTVDFKIESDYNYFAITNYNTNKPWLSTEEGYLPVVVDETISYF